MVEVLIQRLAPHAVLPTRAHPGDAGYDLYASEDTYIACGERQAVSTGLACAIPRGYVGLVHPRSGLALKKGVTVINAPGTIDAGYRGEIKVLLVNHDANEGVTIARGERIAQLLVQRFETVEWHEVADLPGSQRGHGGFGSSGS